MTETISMQPIINALPTLLGVMLGAFGTYYSSKNLKKIEFSHLRQQELRVEKRKCCAEFLGEADRLVIKSIDEKLSSASAMSSLAICLSNIELLCSKNTITAAKLIFDYVLNAHGQSSKEQKHHYSDLKTRLIGFVKEEIAIET